MIENRPEDEIDFLNFGYDYCARETKTGRNVERTVTSLNALSDFCPKGLDIKDLTSGLLRDFEACLRSERTIVRKNQFGQQVKTKENPLSDISGEEIKKNTVYLQPYLIALGNSRNLKTIIYDTSSNIMYYAMGRPSP